MGHIEIENDESEDSDDGFEETEQDGVIYRLPERGIKLDFIDAVKSRYVRLLIFMTATHPNM